MSLELRDMGYRGIDMFCDMQGEAVVVDDAGLLEAGHAFSDIEVDPAV